MSLSQFEGEPSKSVTIDNQNKYSNELWTIGGKREIHESILIIK